MSEDLPGELCLGTLNSPSSPRGIEWTADSLSWCHFGAVWLALFPFLGYHSVLDFGSGARGTAVCPPELGPSQGCDVSWEQE